MDALIFWQAWSKVYDYIFIYANDILIISSEPKKYVDALGTFVELKAGSAGSQLPI